jgi:hypothetical protein
LPPWMADLRQAIAESVTSEDMRAMIKAQVDKAKKGDARACQFVLNYMLGGTKPVQLIQNNFYEQSAPAQERKVIAAETTSDDPPTDPLEIRARIAQVLKDNGPMAVGDISHSIRVDYGTVQAALTKGNFEKRGSKWCVKKVVESA